MSDHSSNEKASTQRSYVALASEARELSREVAVVMDVVVVVFQY